jgi:glycosyltransferase involved in cell wall biosynthesis
MPDGILRVAFASHEASLMGGAERSLLEIALALKRDGRVDSIVTVPEDGALATALRAESIPSFVLPTPWWSWTSTNADSRGPLASAHGLARRGRAMLAVARSAAPWSAWLRAERPDIVVTNTAVIPTPALASAAAGIPHVWWVHEFVTKDHGFTYMLGEPLSQRLIGRLSRLVLANSRAVLGHFSPPIGVGKMRLIYEGIAGFDVPPNKIDPANLRALVLGGLTGTKGVALAIEALSILKCEPICVQLRLVGPIRPAFREELNRRATDLGVADRVEVVGATMTPQTQIAWANVLLMCSRSEAFGRVTAEALKSGRPVVGTRSGGTPELISEGVNGLLFAPGNASELASALRRLVIEPGLLAHLSENTKPSVQDHFTLEDELNKFVAALMTAAGLQSQTLRRRIA